MFKVLIVEDEMLVRIGLKSSIDWGELGMEVIADVSNGQAAWEVYHDQKPDLILTDIKMPIMDGLQLISQIREKDSKTKIIILTAYDEYNLLRKAVQLGISDYILKLKMSIVEMESVLKKVQTELLEENIHTTTAQEDLKANIIHLKENAVKDYLFYGRYSEAEFAEVTNKLHFRISPERLVLCVLAIDKFEQMESKLKDNQGNLIRFSILNIINELLGGYLRGEVLHEKDEKYMLLFSFPDMVSEQTIYQNVQEILSHINNIIKKYLNTSISCGISTINNGYASLKQMYRECVSALEQRFILGNERFIQWQDMGRDNLLKDISMKLEKMWQDSDQFNERYAKEIEAGIKTLTQSASISKAEIQIMVIRWIHWPTVYLNVYMDDISNMALDFAGQIHKCTTLDETIDIFKQFLSELKSSHAKKKFIDKEIAEAAKFIQLHYHQDISLQQVAYQVKLSPNHFSSLFKKNLDLSFIEYLNRFRIDMAKDMLVNTHLKSYEIAEKVGYMDYSYFSRVFKKVTGMRPNEFQKQWFVENRAERMDGDDENVI
ncbi:response regulator [Paenibacillus sp. LMG 31458]|uniref:Response regulator n=1 Tax=Paenibacillus phytorum TaxID=2654977 RepID=A0ABX1XU74_9BACL|nr:response regulator [Paenibacillus phytorum]NOU71378.1 response regulator [Paenibacillus phytorum]